VYCFCGDLIFLDKIKVKKVSECSISPLFRTFVLCYDTFFPQTHFTCCIHIRKQLNIQAREPCFLSSEMTKKIQGCPSINKLYQLSDILVYPITVHRSLHHYKSHYYMSLQVGLGMCRNLAIRFSALKTCTVFPFGPLKEAKE